jgi:hypothetical protein
LNKHRKVPFVKRILDPNAPVRTNDDGSISTVLLSTSGGPHPTDPRLDEPVFVYPTLQFIDGKWVSDSNPTNARNRGNVIYFDNPDKAEALEQARQFAEGAWKPVVEKKFLHEL